MVGIESSTFVHSAGGLAQKQNVHFPLAQPDDLDLLC